MTLPSSTVSAAWPADMPSSTRPAASIQPGTATIMPTHRAAKWYQAQVRCSGPVGARSGFQSELV